MADDAPVAPVTVGKECGDPLEPPRLGDANGNAS